MSKVFYLGGRKVKAKDSELPIENTFTSVNANDVLDGINDNDTRISLLESGNGLESIVAFAQWVEDFKFFVTADRFPVENTFYTALADDVILDPADLTLDRIDIIGAYKPILPATVGTVGKITGLPAAESLVVAPDYDPSLFYPIKIVYVKAGSVVPDGVDNVLLYDENVGEPTEWIATTDSANIVTDSTNDPNTGLVSIESTNQLAGQKIILTTDSPINSKNINLITFFLKLKEVYGQEYIFFRFFNESGAEIGSQYSFKDGDNGFDQSNLSYQQISIDTSKLSLPDDSVKSVQIYLYKAFSGFFLDTIELHKGSGNEVAQPGVEEAPLSGKQYGRQNGGWTEVEVGGDYVDLSTDQTIGGKKLFIQPISSVAFRGTRIDMGFGSDLDLALGDTFYRNPLGGYVDFTISNLPTGNKTVQATFYLTGNHTWTLNQATKIAGTYDGSVLNQIVIEVVNGDTEEIYYSINPIP